MNLEDFISIPAGLVRVALSLGYPVHIFGGPAQESNRILYN